MTRHFHDARDLKEVDEPGFVAADLCATRPVQTKPLTQNTQKSLEPGNAADFAYRDEESPIGVDGLLDALEIVCKDLPVTPGYVLPAMAPEDKKAWRSGELPRIPYGTSQKPSRGVERWTKGGARPTTPGKLYAVNAARPGIAYWRPPTGPADENQL